MKPARTAAVTVSVPSSSSAPLPEVPLIRLRDSKLDPRDARDLLRRLRDLNLGACGIEVSGEERVRLEGCLSLDAPVERGVRYRLVDAAGRPLVLDIAFREGRLRLALDPEEGARGVPREVDVLADRFGRLAVPELAARLDPESHPERGLERFLRRLVRGAFASR